MFSDVGAVTDLPEDGTLPVILPSGDRVCLVRSRGAISALADECTHQAMPLSAGTVLPDGTIECAWHGARFDCRTGALRGGPAEEDVAAFDVRVEAGRILVGGRRAAE
jgi:3-phenylpropionate/trans-cinnamate dioxygenase ferredoxin subunit